MEGVYTITIIYNFTIAFSLCAKDIIKLYAATKISERTEKGT